VDKMTGNLAVLVAKIGDRALKLGATILKRIIYQFDIKMMVLRGCVD
jgi:hypothetical protein